MGILKRLFGSKTSEPTPDVRPSGRVPTSSEHEPPPGQDKPPKCARNPGKSVGGRIAFTNGEQKWTESFDLVRLAGDVLRSRGHEVVEHGTWLEVRPSGFILQPLLVDIELLEKGGVHTLTTIDVRHAELIKHGLFEYQHATGDHVVDSLIKGFESWESVDLPVLLDALRPKPEKCTLWELTLPARDGVPARVRRAVLGSVACVATRPPVADGKGCENPQEEVEHAFCNCCFLTRNFEAFRSQIEGDECVGIRFYAMRDADGTPGADCRLNGEDYELGITALRSYVATWPGVGFESRKQYVFIHSVTAS